MERNDFKLFIALSLFLHASVFLISVVQAHRSAYITLPIELLFSSPPGAPTPSVSLPAKEPAKTAAPAKPAAKDEIAIPKKKEKKAVEKKTEAPAPAPAPVSVPAPSASSLPGTAAPGGGGQVSLDNANFPYAYYTSTIVKKIGRSWQWANEFGRMKSVVFFRIRKDGSVAEVSIKTSSGDSMFDQQAIRAIKLSDPFPPLPTGYGEDTLGVFFEFSYH
jgi:TonB family protein